MAMSQPAVVEQPCEAGVQTDHVGEDSIYETIFELDSRCTDRIDELAVSVF